MHLVALQLLMFVLNVWARSERGQPSQAANGRPQISGRIVDRLGCPLIATLTLRHGREPVDGRLQEVQSNMDGRFTFQDVPPGRYWLDYALEPGGTGGDSVVVTEDGTYKAIRWSLTPDTQTSDASVVVTDSDGRALAGAAVAWRRFSGALDGPSCETASATTDVQGRVQVNGLPPGKYRVVIGADGFVPQTRDIGIGFAQKPTSTVRLLTPVESERRARSLFRPCSPWESSSEPQTLPALVSGSDAIVVGRIRTAVLDPDYTAPDYPVVLTRYDVELPDVIKPHAHLATTTRHIALVQSAGELDWGKDVLVGCSGGHTMRPGEIYVLFLTWNDHSQMFMLTRENDLLADITSDSVTPFRVLDTPAAIIAAHTGQSAADFVRDIRTALRESP